MSSPLHNFYQSGHGYVGMAIITSRQVIQPTNPLSNQPVIHNFHHSTSTPISFIASSLFAFGFWFLGSVWSRDLAELEYNPFVSNSLSIHFALKLSNLKAP